MYSDKFSGILNGIDYSYYNPETDPAIEKKYGSDSAIEGKTANKLALQRATGLPERADVPMIALITRLATHKGLDLVTEIAVRLLDNDVQLVVLGTGETELEDFFRWLESEYPDKCRALITYNRDLAKKLYAASDEDTPYWTGIRTAEGIELNRFGGTYRFRHLPACLFGKLFCRFPYEISLICRQISHI